MTIMATDFTPYLGFDGPREEAFNRNENVFGGKILMMMRHSDAPPGSGAPQTPGVANRIKHARLQVGDRLLMAATGRRTAGHKASASRSRWTIPARPTASSTSSPRAGP
jgi:uncharacterized glyoxalase superfamily protein PhnB